MCCDVNRTGPRFQPAMRYGPVPLQAWFAFYVLRGGTGAGGADERRFVPEAPPGAGIAGSMLKVRRLALLAFGCIAVGN